MQTALLSDNCGSFAGGEIRAGRRGLGQFGVALAKPRNTPRPACGERVGVRGLRDYLSPQEDELKTGLLHGTLRQLGLSIRDL
jgi:hypothetical protein